MIYHALLRHTRHEWVLVPPKSIHFNLKLRKKYSSGPRYWNVPVLVNTGTFLVNQYCLKMWYLRPLERAGDIQKLTILERKNGLVLSNTRVPVSGTWIYFFWNLICIFGTKYQAWSCLKCASSVFFLRPKKLCCFLPYASNPKILVCKMLIL